MFVSAGQTLKSSLLLLLAYPFLSCPFFLLIAAPVKVSSAVWVIVCQNYDYGQFRPTLARLLGRRNFGYVNLRKKHILPAAHSSEES